MLKSSFLGLVKIGRQNSIQTVSRLPTFVYLMCRLLSCPPRFPDSYSITVRSRLVFCLGFVGCVFFSVLKTTPPSTPLPPEFGLPLVNPAFSLVKIFLSPFSVLTPFRAIFVPPWRDPLLFFLLLSRAHSRSTSPPPKQISPSLSLISFLPSHCVQLARILFNHQFRLEVSFFPCLPRYPLHSLPHA